MFFHEIAWQKLEIIFCPRMSTFRGLVKSFWEKCGKFIGNINEMSITADELQSNVDGL